MFCRSFGFELGSSTHCQLSLVQNCAPRKCISNTVLIGCDCAVSCMIFTFGVDKLSRLARVLWVLCLTCNCKRIVYRRLFLWYLLNYSSLVFTEAVVFILQLVWAKKFPQAFQMITSCKRWKERHFSSKHLLRWQVVFDWAYPFPSALPFPLNNLKATCPQPQNNVPA